MAFDRNIHVIEHNRTTCAALLDLRPLWPITSNTPWELLVTAVNLIIDGHDNSTYESLRSRLARDGTLICVGTLSDSVRIYMKALSQYALKTIEDLWKTINSPGVRSSNCSRICGRLSAQARNAASNPLNQIIALATMKLFGEKHPIVFSPYGRPAVFNNLRIERIMRLVNSIVSETEVSFLAFSPPGMEWSRFLCAKLCSTKSVMNRSTYYHQQKNYRKLKLPDVVSSTGTFTGSTVYLAYSWDVSSAQSTKELLTLDLLCETINSSGSFFQNIRDVIGASHIILAITKRSYDATVFMICVTLPVSRVDTVANSVSLALEKFLAGDFSTEEFESAKQRYIAVHIDSVVNDPLGTYIVKEPSMDLLFRSDFRYQTVEQFLETILSLKTKYVKDFIARYLESASSLEIRLLPHT